MPNIAALSWEQSYQISPIILTGAGVAANVPGGMIPIISLTQPGAFPAGLLSPGGNIDTDNCIKFRHLPGDTFVDQQFGEYPFANQAVAANAVIAQPLKCSLLMIAPANVANGITFANKLSLMTSIIQTLTQHNQTGGTYSVLTPSFLYTNCLMRTKFDASSGESLQPQTEYRLDFEQPLLTQQQAAQAYNNLMAKINSQTQVQGQPQWSGSGSQTVGVASSGVAPATIPATTPLAGSSTAPTGGINNPGPPPSLPSGSGSLG